MKKLKELLNYKTAAKICGIVIGIAAIYLSLRNIRSDELKHSLETMDTMWILPIVVGNFFVIAFKAMRWQIMIKPVKKIRFSLMYKVLTIGFMANNVLPARLGEAVRIHMLGKDAFISRVTTTATLIADRIIEVVSFLLIATLLIMLTVVPRWMYNGLTITLLGTLAIYTVIIIYSKKEISNHFLKKFQMGVRPLLNIKTSSLALVVSLISWFLQGMLIYMSQLAFGVHLPLWGIVLVLIAVNLAVAIPSTPSHLGTFEFACILAYSYLGIDKSLGLLIGVTYHLLQVVPVTLVGGLMLLFNELNRRKTLPVQDHDIAC